jgi:hypothetical protein
MRGTLHEERRDTMGMRGLALRHWLLRRVMRWCAMHLAARSRNIQRCLGIISLIVLVAGCQSPQMPAREPASANNAIRNNAASLLYELMGEEADLSKLLIIKRERDELDRVVKNISSSASAAHKTLARLAKEDPTLDLKHTDLPAGEKAVREAMSKRKGGELLKASGADFEFKLLLTQIEALAYAEQLARIAGLNESNPTQSRVFAEIATQMDQLHGEALSVLRAGQENSPR